jgi:hypothetical protein
MAKSSAKRKVILINPLILREKWENVLILLDTKAVTLKRMTTMRNPSSGYVVSARDPAGGGAVYFDGAGQWTADLRNAQIARSRAGRRALLRVAAALTEGTSVVAPDLVPVPLAAAE